MESKDYVGENLEEIMTYVGRSLDQLDERVWKLEHDIRRLRIAAFLGVTGCLILIAFLFAAIC